MKRGFTLIEILVAASIVSLFSSMALTATHNAYIQTKATVGKAEMKNMYLAGELFFANHHNYGSEGDYEGGPTPTISCSTYLDPNPFFDDEESGMKGFLRDLKKQVGIDPDDEYGGANVSLLDCGASIDRWSISARLPSGEVWCTDSTGVSRNKNEEGVPYECVSQAICYPPHSFAHQGIGYGTCL